MRIFVDANLLFSAAKSDGAVRQLLHRLRRAGHKGELVGTHPDNLALASKLPLPDEDKPVLLAAIAARCQALVTGDQTHFGPLCPDSALARVLHSGHHQMQRPKMTKTVHAVRRGQSLDLLEPLDVPEGTELAVTIEISPRPAQIAQAGLPVRSLGPIKGRMGREDIYGAAG